MKRRSFLKSIAAGSMVAHPLACLLARNAMAMDGSAPVRTIFLFHPNGCVPDAFFPDAGTMDLKQMSAPLERVKDNIVFLDGIGYAGSANTHEGGSFKCLTGRMANGDTQSSIDVLMGKEDWANRASTGVSVQSVQMGVGMQWGSDSTKRISYDGSTSLGASGDPRIVYPRLFGNYKPPGDGGSPSQPPASESVETKMLSAAREDLNRLKTQLGQLERERIQQHEEALSVLEAKFESSTGGGGGGNGMACTLPDISRTPMTNSGDTETELSQTSNLDIVSDIQQDIAVAALSCGITRSMAFSYGVSVSPVKVPGGGIGDHDASHQDVDAHTKSKVWWIGQIAQFIEKLANTPDVNGSLLDNTVLVTLSDLGHGNYHDHYRIPMFLASGKENNLGLVTGRTLDFRPYGTSKKIGDGPEHPTINHTDVLDTVRQVAGYTGFEMPNKEGDIFKAWRGGNEPR